MNPCVPTDAPLISIAMCTYNGEKYLRDQIDSLIAQDYPNLEIQIVDDRSTDSTFRILEEYAASHPHIHIHRNEQNLGFRRNFEKALSLCSGEFISLCDQDDIWFPHKVRALYNAIGDCSLVYSNVQLITEDGTEIDADFPPKNMMEGRCHLALLLNNCVTGHACLIRKDLLEKAIPIPGEVVMHDHWIAFVAAAAGGIKLHPGKLSLYRQHSSNAISRSKDHKKPSKAQRRIKLYEERMAFVNSAATLDWLPEEDGRLIREIQAALAKYPTCYYNRSMRKVLLKNMDALLAIYRIPEKGLRKLSRGYYRDML